MITIMCIIYIYISDINSRFSETKFERVQSQLLDYSLLSALKNREDMSWPY